MSRLLKVSVLLFAAPFVFAEENPLDLELSFEIKGGANYTRLISDVPNEDVTVPADGGAGHRISELTREFFQSLSIPVREAFDKIPYSFGGRVVGMYRMNDDFNISLYAGVDTGLASGDTPGTYTQITIANRDANANNDTNGRLENRNGPELEEDLHLNGGLRLGYRNIALFAEYDVSKLKVSGNVSTASIDALNGEHSFDNVLFGMRAESLIEVDDINLNVFAEGSTNLSGKVDSETKEYVLALSKAYLTDIVDAGRVGGLPSATHASIMKLSVGLGFNFANL